MSVGRPSFLHACLAFQVPGIRIQKCEHNVRVRMPRPRAVPELVSRQAHPAICDLGPQSPPARVTSLLHPETGGDGERDGVSVTTAISSNDKKHYSRSCRAPMLWRPLQRQDLALNADTDNRQAPDTQDFLPSLQAKQAVFLVPFGKDQPCPLQTRWIPVDLPVEPCSHSRRPRRGGSGFVEASEAG
jgi:hypothetical protein